MFNVLYSWSAPSWIFITLMGTDQVYTDRQLARVSVLTFDVTSAVSRQPLASVWQASGKCHEKI